MDKDAPARLRRPSSGSPHDRSSRSRSGSPIITGNTSLQSFQPRQTQFELDDGPKRSSFQQAEARPVSLKRAAPEAVPYSASAPAVELRPDGKIVQIESSLSDSGILGTVRSVSYGSWEGSPACLIAMRYFFRFAEGNRFKAAQILVTFDAASKKVDAGSGRRRANAPVVRNFSPRKVYGQRSEESKAWHYDVGLEAALPSGPASITPSIGAGRESSFTREHHLEVIGKPWSSRDHLDFNQVVWTAHETKTQKHGIPDELNLAVVVQHDGPFQAFVEAEGKVAGNLALRAWPWDRRHPLLFDGVTQIGKPPARTEFDKLTAAEWRSLAPFTGEYENVVSLEAARSQLNAADGGVPPTGLGITDS
ncbi:MAG: hypothetical protein INR71_02285 [Terriglobus roseus]|nr:hypothetical protein [Terriglobus roseus]